MSKSVKRKTAPSRPAKHSKSATSEILKKQRIQIISGIFLILFALFLCCVMLGFLVSGGIDQSIVDTSVWEIVSSPQTRADNPGGWFGANIADLLINHWFGLSSFILCYLLILSGVKIAGGKVKQFSKKWFIGIVLILWISLFLGFISESIAHWFTWDTGYLFPGGGHGYFVSMWLSSLIGRIGTILFLLLTFITKL